MRTLYIFFIVLIFSFQGLAQEAFDYSELCEKYKTWFASDTIKWTYEDSLASYEYNDKLCELYKPIKEMYYNCDQSYFKIYEALHYDTTLLFSILKLYTKSKEEYDEQIGIPLFVALSLLKHDAFISGTVVDKIDHYKECRFYTTTYFIRTDSVIFSYFPIEVGDTVIIHSPIIGYYGYCQKDTILGYRRDKEEYDYQVGDSISYIYLNRNGFVRFHHHKPREVSKFSADHKDPFCWNSFVFSARTNEIYFKGLKETNQKKLGEFTKRIKTWGK